MPKPDDTADLASRVADLEAQVALLVASFNVMAAALTSTTADAARALRIESARGSPRGPRSGGETLKVN